VADVNEALQDVNKVLREVEDNVLKSHRTELDKVKRTLGKTASTVASELALGRWIWKVRGQSQSCMCGHTHAYILAYI
jgi:hypothetical protein